jgi:hypothetical protein
MKYLKQLIQYVNKIRKRLKNITCRWILFMISDRLIRYYFEAIQPEVFHQGRNKKNYLTLTYRPKLVKNICKDVFAVPMKEKIGIVIQGPIKREDNFTYETIQLYKKIFPDALLILSTWEDEDKLTIEKLRKTGIIILLNEKPVKQGFVNLNYQIVSTKAGIDFAKKNGVNYLLKTRTDCRIYDGNGLNFLVSLLKQFKLPDEVKYQKQRIIALDTFTHKYRPYSISDIVQFGNIDDMQILWSLDLDRSPRIEVTDFLNRCNTYIDELNSNLSEPYIIMRYLEKINEPVMRTIRHYYEVLIKRFLIIDKETLNLYWFKHNNWEQKWRQISTCERDMIGQHIRFKDWMILYNYLDEIENIDEGILNSKIK